MRRLLVPALSCLIAVACAVGLSVAFADDGEPSLPESVTTTLQPGDNRIGWVAERVSAEDLFVQLPRVVLVYAWNASSGRYEIAAPRLPRRYWTIRYLEPGRGYVLRVGGPGTVEWQRSVLPASGLVSLRSGLNWSAWAGRDDATIADVARGIGSSLVSIRSDDLFYDPSAPESVDDWPAVRRGDALEVRVSRDVNWLQPTFVMPQIHYAGNVDHGVRRLIERDLEATLEYSARELGVQADPSSLVVVVAGDAKSAHDKTTELGHSWEWESFRNFWQRAGGWYSSGQDAFYLKSSTWEGPRSGRYPSGRYVVLHEYIHALQFQLMGASDIDLNWLLEGSANWFESDLSTQDRNGYPLSRRLIDALNQASKGPPLEEIESANDTWQYSFGLVAADLLIDRAGKGAALDFYRVLAPGRAGPGGRWETRPTMRSAFTAAFGLSLEEFYDEFEALMAKRRGSAKRRPAGNEFALAGTIVNTDGTPRVGASLEAREYQDGVPAGWNRRATSSEDGTFEVFVRRRADYRIWIELGEDAGHCQYWWSEDSDDASASDDDASLIEIGSSQPESITISVDAGRCRWQVAGTLSGPDDLPLAGLQVRAHGDGSVTSVRTELDGSFSFVAIRPGPFQLSVYLGGCRLYWNANGPTANAEQAADIQVLSRDVSGLRFQVLKDPCTRISGRLQDANGDGLANVNLYAQAEGPRTATYTDAAGSFRFALPEPGEYRIYGFLNGCVVRYRDGSATGVWHDATPITLSEDDVTGIVMTIPADMCTLRISGTFLNADGTPKTGIWIGASGESGSGGARPADDGSFSFAVPGPGVYDMWVTIDGCEIYFAGSGKTGAKSERRSLNITRSDITGIEFRLPEDPASVCN